MTALSASPAAEPASEPLHDRAAAEAYVASVCFKHGPPRLLGAELEWTVHHAGQPRRQLTAQDLCAALGDHTPLTLNPISPNRPLRHGSLVTVEPGGQVEISAPPHPALTALLNAVAADAAELAALLADHGLVLGRQAFDPHREPRLLLDTPRYTAMANSFAPEGPDGIAWMCASAGLQVCLDIGEPDRAATRWAAVNALGPVLSALFANSDDHDRPDGWSSARMRAMFGADPQRTSPAPVTADPAASWAELAVNTPLICVRRPEGRWDVPPGVSFADWINGALDRPPTVDDLDYHLSTLFPPVRPRGYLEVRYLDTQPGEDWIAPVALLAALFADEATVDAVVAATEPVADRWLPSARDGLTDPPIARAVDAVLAIGETALSVNTDLSEQTIGSVLEMLDERRHKAGPAGGELA
ncbi:MAG TPA: glutamate-cysteine ligase family protein [Pseudonocardiaceae bacterium]|jgi:glutamate--cysteine ligase|nr:glutamate-cysteine ligase family protein [Pseudonocardiaceae bacterium]